MITNGKVVGLAYTLTDDAGVIIDSATNQDAFTYLHGGMQIVPGLETALEGMKVGEQKKVSVSPEEGYGEVNPSLTMTVKRAQFPANADIQAGMQFQAQSPEGHGMVFTVTKLAGDEVTIDGNHPMAGKTLNFSIEVLSVRDATAEELSHGHAHGPDGHHHH